MRDTTLNPQTPDARSEWEEERKQSLRYLQRELRDSVGHVKDPDLQQDVADFLSRVAEVPEGGVVEHVSQHLADIRRREPDDDDDREMPGQYPMRRTDGDKDFPESCAACPHSPTRCPVFNAPDERRYREQLASEYAEQPNGKAATAYQQYAQEVGCHQIDRAVKDFRKKYGPLVSEGWDLFGRVQADLSAGVGKTSEEAEAAEEVAQIPDNL